MFRRNFLSQLPGIAKVKLYQLREKRLRAHQKLPSSQPVDHNLMMIIDYFAAFHSLWHCGQP